MKIVIKTRDNKISTVETESDEPRLAIKQAMDSPLTPENVKEVLTMKRIDIDD